MNRATLTFARTILKNDSKTPGAVECNCCSNDAKVRIILKHLVMSNLCLFCSKVYVDCLSEKTKSQATLYLLGYSEPLTVTLHWKAVLESLVQ